MGLNILKALLVMRKLRNTNAILGCHMLTSYIDLSQHRKRGPEMGTAGNLSRVHKLRCAC